MPTSKILQSPEASRGVPVGYVWLGVCPCMPLVGLVAPVAKVVCIGLYTHTQQHPPTLSKVGWLDV